MAESLRGKEEIVRHLAYVTRTKFLRLGRGSKERKQSLVTAAKALGVSASGTKQQYAAAIAHAGGQTWTKACFSTGDTVTRVGLDRVLAAAVALGTSSERLDARVEQFLESQQAEAAVAEVKEGTVSHPRVIALRTLRRARETAIKPEAFSRAAPPERRRVLLEKALKGHGETLDDLAAGLTEGCAAYEDPDSIDLLVRCGTRSPLLVEVKTLAGGVVTAARRALAQVYEYRYRFNEPSTILAICFDHRPTGVIWLLPFLTADRGINVLWKSSHGFQVVGPHTSEIQGLFRSGHVSSGTL